MAEKTNKKNARKWVLFILGFVIIALSFQLSKTIIDSNPPPRKKAKNTLKDVYTISVKNGPYQVEL